MKAPGQLLRLLHIQLVLVRHGLDELLLAAPLLGPWRFLRWLLPWRWLRRELPPRAVRIRAALEELGPIFVKFGQALSTRRDLLPDDVAQELARLQDRVPPFPGRQARAIVERALGLPVAACFARFEEEPLASASIAQVHAATLLDGREVVVKVVRPGIRRVIQRDIALLYTLAELAQRYWKEGRRLRPVEVVAEYERTILDELDLLREAANGSQLRRNFAGSELLYVPEVHWPLCRREVMVLERIHGIPVSDVAALRRAGVDLRALAERGVEIFFTQVFRHNFFHADMHPGNIFVDPTRPQAPRYLAVDFGIMGSLSPEDQRYLAENFVAFFNRDYRRVAELHVESGWVPPGTRVDEFEAAIRTVCEPIFERPLKEISFGQLLLRLFQTARRFRMEVQPQLLLLQKTLLNIEGLGRELYPDLDLWTTAKPFLERWMQEQVGLRGLARELRRRAPRWAERLPELPDLAHEVLRRAERGELELRLRSRDLERLRRTQREGLARLYAAVVGAGLVVAAAVTLPAGGTRPLMLGNTPAITWILGLLGAMLILGAWPRR